MEWEWIFSEAIFLSEPKWWQTFVSDSNWIAVTIRGIEMILINQIKFDVHQQRGNPWRGVSFRVFPNRIAISKCWFFFPPLEGGKQEDPKGNPRGRGLGLSRLCSKMLESCPGESQKVVEKLPKVLTFKICHQNLLTIFIKTYFVPHNNCYHRSEKIPLDLIKEIDSRQLTI